MSKFKVGDRVRRVKHSTSMIRNCPIGYVTKVDEMLGSYGFWYISEDGSKQNSPSLQDWELVEGPVRNVTRTEIVPGVYGRVKVGGENYNGQHTGNGVAVSFTLRGDSQTVTFAAMNAAELRDAANTFTVLADALDEVAA